MFSPLSVCCVALPSLPSPLCSPSCSLAHSVVHSALRCVHNVTSMGESCSVRIEPISYICVCYESPLIWQSGSSVNAAFTRSVPLPSHTMQATHPLAARSRGNEQAREPPFPYSPLPLAPSLTECALSLPPVPADDSAEIERANGGWLRRRRRR